jgi:hypothetical protein
MLHSYARTSTVTERVVRVTTVLAAVAVVTAGWGGARVLAQEPSTHVARGVRWSAEGELRALFKDPATVKSFLGEIESGGDATEPDVIGDVEEYRLVDLDRDGWLELVALVSGTGRKLSPFLVVVYQTPEGTPPSDRLATTNDGFVMRSLSGVGVENLTALFRDLDNDGTYEIVMPELLGPFEGAARPQATMPEVYEWKAGDFVRVSSRYPEFYRDEVLPQVEGKLQKLEELPTPAAAGDRAELRALREAYVREIAEARKRATQRKNQRWSPITNESDEDHRPTRSLAMPY